MLVCNQLNKQDKITKLNQRREIFTKKNQKTGCSKIRHVESDMFDYCSVSCLSGGWSRDTDVGISACYI